MSWLARLKNSNVPASGTDKTDKSPIRPLLSVLAVPPPGTNEKHEEPVRVVVRYKVNGRGGTAIGVKPRAEIIRDLRRMHGDDAIEVLP